MLNDCRNNGGNDYRAEGSGGSVGQNFFKGKSDGGYRCVERCRQTGRGTHGNQVPETAPGNCKNTPQQRRNGGTDLYRRTFTTQTRTRSNIQGRQNHLGWNDPGR